MTKIHNGRGPKNQGRTDSALENGHQRGMAATQQKRGLEEATPRDLAGRIFFLKLKISRDGR